MKFTLYFVLGVVLMLSACTGNHLIHNKEYLSVIDNSFIERKQLASNRDAELFSVFNKELSVKQEEALKFIIAFMPLSDLADYSGDFLLANADMSLRALTETPWGKDIPEEIFLHYILPCRVNNENLDSFRIIYYDEIQSRIKGMQILDAALEINHWCHEKVSYQASDSRTSAPMSTILSARGRCGEESTFTVAALRTAGIPARQVYTPRWAHSDDNHAWVEIWNNGNWYYMGACEPEPVIDRGWFTEPARRAMLVHTKSFGAFSGNENVINKHKNFTEVNNLSKYAVTKKIFVKVIDKNGILVPNANVEYQLYNYAEFYPLAVVPTDSSGISQFETGLGDLLIWASKNDEFDYRKISVNETDTLYLILTRKDKITDRLDFDLNVPVKPAPYIGTPVDLIEKNSKRIAFENELRQKYIDSWMSQEDARRLALKLNSDSAKIMKIFSRSMGNYAEIKLFLINTPADLMSLALSMLEILPDKDLRDIKAHILSDHLNNSFKPSDLEGEAGKSIFLNYILNPRINNEMIVEWRSYLRQVLPSSLIAQAASDPLHIVNFINENIKIAHDENYYKTPLTPRGVIALKVSDSGSRAICFVAICRSLGIPSRLEPGTNTPQYYFNSKWNDVFFSDQEQPEKMKGYIKFKSEDTAPVPEYYIHFTIARLDKGRYNTLEYDFNKKITDFKEELALTPGNYMVVTGNRIDDSKILSNISFFELSENQHKSIDVKLRQDVADNKLLGRIDLDSVISNFDLKITDIKKITEKGVVIIWIEPEKEPTKHIFNDLPLLKKELDVWGGYFLFISATATEGKGFKPEEIKGLPANSLFGTDIQMKTIKFSPINCTPAERSLPYIIQTDNKGNILFTSSGYRIGIGEQILKHVK